MLILLKDVVIQDAHLKSTEYCMVKLLMYSPLLHITILGSHKYKWHDHYYSLKSLKIHTKLREHCIEGT